MSVQSYPPDMWETILSQLRDCYPDRKYFGYQRGIKGSLACALTSRTLSAIARPHIWRRILIDSEERGLSLGKFLTTSPNQNIIPMIHEVFLGAPLHGRRRAFWNWLSSNDGLSLLSLLTHVRHLSSHNAWLDSALDSWKVIRTFRTITSLSMHLCEIPSLRLALELLTETFPNLCDLQLEGVDTTDCLDVFSIQSLNSIKERRACLVRKIAIKSGCLDFLSQLLPYVKFPSLRQVALTPADWPHNRGYAFFHLQNLLHHAPLLERLTFVRCFRVTRSILRTLDFGSNQYLKSITFDGVNDRIHFSWYAYTLKTLPRITQLRHLSFIGELETLDDQTWLLLDNILSEPDLTSSPDVRTLVFEHVREHVSARGAFKVTSAYDFPQELLEKTIALGAFDISWPIPVSSIEAGVSSTRGVIT